MEASKFGPPLDRLFQLGKPDLNWPEKTVDYAAELGIHAEHIPALIEIALAWPDALKSDDAEGWASPHAWRALAQLRAVETVEPLLGVMNRLNELHDDWYLEEFPEVFAMIGPAAIPLLAAYMADASNTTFARSAAAGGLKSMAKQHPETRPQVMAHLNAQLARFEETDEEFNSLLISDLLNLDAVESLELMRQAYSRGKVVEGMVAWEDVQKRLGISEPKPPRRRWEMPVAKVGPPLDRLFTMGEVELGVEWRGTDPDYVAELGLTNEHVPALIEMARWWQEADEYPEEDAGWAPIHAWRGLAQLRAAEAVEPLLAMLTVLTTTGDDYHMYEFPVVFGMIGQRAIHALAAYLHDPKKPRYARVTVGNGLCNVGLRNPEARGEAIQALADQLARSDEKDYELNGHVVEQLTRLKAVEAAETIERAFAANRVDDEICGYWGAERQTLGVAGLGLAPDEPPRRTAPAPLPFDWQAGPLPGTFEHAKKRTQKKKEKAKRKQQAKSKKRNRKRQ